MKKVQELRDAGNWNLVVLYAMEWTRKEPGNAMAWDQLRDGYRFLRQYEDARSAATKATQLAPDDARLWRKLGEANLDLDNPEGALAAFEQTVARNGQDVGSWQQIALIEARSAARRRRRPRSTTHRRRHRGTRSPHACARVSRR